MKKNNPINKYVLVIIFLALFAIISIFLISITEHRSDANMNNKSNSEKLTTKNTEDSSSFEETTSYNPADSAIEEMSTAPSGDAAKHLIDFDADFPYQIRVNRTQNYVIIYGIDKNGRYSIPYKGFMCSVGKDVKDTPTGSFKTSDYYPWRLMVDGSYAQYAIRINGSIMLHSIPYYSAHNDDLESEEYNKLGSNASLGCVRLNINGIKWIYDNCASGTKVYFYKDSNPGPLGKPSERKISGDSEVNGWDPTDPDSDNPWKNYDSTKKNDKENMESDKNNNIENKTENIEQNTEQNTEISDNTENTETNTVIKGNTEESENSQVGSNTTNSEIENNEVANNNEDND